MSVTDKARKQIRAILAKAQAGSGATEEEAASALQFAKRMMQKLRISEADLGGGERTPHELAAEAEYREAYSYMNGVSIPRWSHGVACAVARTIGTVRAMTTSCTEKRSASGMLEFGKDGKRQMVSAYVFLGPSSDSIEAVQLYEEWCLTITALARMKHGSVARGEGLSYADGFSFALYEAACLSDSKDQKLIEQGSSDPHALMVIRSVDLATAYRAGADRWLESKGIRVASGKRTSRQQGFSAEAYGDGKADGANARLERTRTKRIGQ